MYTKIFSSLYEGTLATLGWQIMVVFQQFLILANADGIVDMTPEAISRITTIPVDIIKTGIAALEQPDPESRSPAHDGRRIVRLSESRSWGWRIVNYGAYRAIRDEASRREYQRQWAKNHRVAKGAAVASTDVDTSSTGDDDVDPSRSRSRSREKTRAQPEGFAEFWLAYPKKREKQNAIKAWIKLEPDESLRQEILKAVAIWKKGYEWSKDGGVFIPYPAKWLNGHRWEDQLEVEQTPRVWI